MVENAVRDPACFCETCSAPIHPGDLAYIDSDGVGLCAEHAPKLSDAIRQWDDAINGGDDGFWWERCDTIAEAEDFLARMRTDLAANGDRSLAAPV